MCIVIFLIIAFLAINTIQETLATLDTFYAKGNIIMHIGGSSIVDMDINNNIPDIQKSPVTQSSLHLPPSPIGSISTESISLAQESNLSNNNTSANNNIENMSVVKDIKGQWNLKIINGNPEIFKTILVASDKNNNPINAYAIYNLRDTGHVQLNNLGYDIINGKVDLKSVGKSNKTITDIEATIVIDRFNDIKMIFGNSSSNSNNSVISKNQNLNYIFNEKIEGKTLLMVDSAGTALVDNRPKQSVAVIPQPQPQPLTPTAPTPTPQPSINQPFFSYSPSYN